MVCKINLKEINTLYIIKQQLENTMEDKTVLTASNKLNKKSVKTKWLEENRNYYQKIKAVMKKRKKDSKSILSELI